MNIVCISDTHDQHEKLNDILPDGDMIIHAGDISLRGSLAEIQDFLKWFSNLPYRYKICIAGNHDFALEKKDSLVEIPQNVIYLNNQEITIEGITIWGSPVTLPFYNWAFMWPLEKRCQLYKEIPNNCDIIISHGPVFGTLDKVKIGQNVGCPLLKVRVEEIKPKLFICGHIHEAYGSVTKNSTTYINASIMNLRYEPINLPIKITF
ncbi:MAG: metallophosphoesterase [Burkholderiales bacterium]|jgi:Icc-related predicted phosphoesterase|nr:metallophosphoesterase [Burkholderiales bacterium]